MRKPMTFGRIAAYTLTFIFSGAVSANAASLFLDGWGVSYGDWDVSALAPIEESHVVEDWTGGGWGYLDPGYGGDAYDAEAAYIANDSNYLYLAVVTGFPIGGRSSNGDYYAAGDLALDINCDGDYDFAVDVDEGGRLRHGNLHWERPEINGQEPWGGEAGVLRADSWQSTTTIEAFRYAEWDGRYAIEAVIDLADLGFAETYSMHWTMGCGNDYIEVSHECATDPVPEPASLLLLGSGLGIAGAYYRRKRARS